MRIRVYSAKRFELDYLKAHPGIIKNIEGSNVKLQLDPIETRLDTTTVSLASGYDAVCVFVNDIVDSDVLKSLASGGTQCVLLRCAGFNNVDLNAAKNAGVRVLRVPAYSPYAVAEFAVALLLAVVRKTHKAYNRTREGNFALYGLMGFDIHGKTVGILGTGKIGRLFAKIMLGFGAKVIAHDLYPSQAAKDMGVEYVNRDDLFAMSDILSLHCPLLPSTRHIVGEDAVKKLKRGVIIINTSRGELVNTDAVITGLRSGVIGGMALDVYEGEGDLFFEDHSDEILNDEKISILLGFHNVIVTPHIAFCTDNALSNIWKTTIANAVEYFNEKSSSNSGPLTNEVA